jgi:hypothetical protein
LQLGGQAATVHALLAGFPADVRAADAELATVAAADLLAWGSLEAAERYVTLADRGLASVPAGQQAQAQLLLGVVRLLLARQRGDLSAVVEQARRLQGLAEAPDAVRPGLGEDLHALVLINLGIAEVWTGLLGEAERHLEQGVASLSQAAEALAGRLTAPHMLIPRTRALLLHALVRLGDTEDAEQVLADLGDQGRDHGLIRVPTAALRLAQHGEPPLPGPVRACLAWCGSVVRPATPAWRSGRGRW